MSRRKVIIMAAQPRTAAARILQKVPGAPEAVQRRKIRYRKAVETVLTQVLLVNSLRAERPEAELRIREAEQNNNKWQKR